MSLHYKILSEQQERQRRFSEESARGHAELANLKRRGLTGEQLVQEMERYHMKRASDAVAAAAALPEKKKRVMEQLACMTEEERDILYERIQEEAREWERRRKRDKALIEYMMHK